MVTKDGDGSLWETFDYNLPWHSTTGGQTMSLLQRG
jgi:hypothetical protein